MIFLMTPTSKLSSFPNRTFALRVFPSSITFLAKTNFPHGSSSSSSILFHTIQVIYKIRDNLLTNHMYQVAPKKVTPSDQAQNEQQKRTPQNCCAFHTRPNRSTPPGPPSAKGYKVTKKIIHFSKHYLMISYD